MKNAIVFLGTLMWAHLAGATALYSEISLPNVGIRPGVTSTIKVSVYANRNICIKNNVLALAGLAHSGKTWKNLSEAMFDDHSLRTRVCKVYAINYPGRGGSGLPTGAGVQLSDLGLNDYATIALNVLEKLRARGVYFDSIMGHSAGTIEIELMQNRLVASHTDLKQKYGIKNAILIAPSGTKTQLVPDNGSLGGLLDAFTTLVPGVGPAITVPDSLFTNFFFTNLTGAMDPAAPTTAQVTASGINSIESVKFAKEVVWAAPETSPSVNAGIFGLGKTQVTVIAGNNDIYVPVALAQAEYVHITGDSSLSRVRIISNDYAVHDLLFSHPQWIIPNLPLTF